MLLIATVVGLVVVGLVLNEVTTDIGAKPAAARAWSVLSAPTRPDSLRTGGASCAPTRAGSAFGRGSVGGQ